MLTGTCLLADRVADVLRGATAAVPTWTHAVILAAVLSSAGVLQTRSDAVHGQ